MRQMISILFLTTLIQITLTRPSLEIIDDLPKHPGGIGGLFRGPNAETIIKGPDGSVITASESPGKIIVDAAAPAAIITEPIIAAEPVQPVAVAQQPQIVVEQPLQVPVEVPVVPIEVPVQTNVELSQAVAVEPIVQPQNLHVIETEIIDAPDVEPEQNAELVGPSGSIITKGSKSIVSGPSSTTISVPSKSIGVAVPINEVPISPIQDLRVSSLDAPLQEIVPINPVITPIQEELPLGPLGPTSHVINTELLPPITNENFKYVDTNPRQENTVSYSQQIVATDLNTGTRVEVPPNLSLSTPSPVLVPSQSSQTQGGTLSLPGAELVAPIITSNGISPEYSFNINLGQELVAQDSVEVSNNIVSSTVLPNNNNNERYLPRNYVSSSTISPINIEVDYAQQSLDNVDVISSSTASPVQYTSSLGTINVADDNIASSTLAPSTLGSTAPQTFLQSSTTPVPSEIIQLTSESRQVIGTAPQIDTASSYGVINNNNNNNVLVSSTIRPVTEDNNILASTASNVQLSQESVQRYLQSVVSGGTPQNILPPGTTLEDLGITVESDDSNIQRIPLSTPGTVRVDGRIDLAQQTNDLSQLDPRDAILNPIDAGHFAAANFISQSNNFDNLAKYGLGSAHTLFNNVGTSAVSGNRGQNPATSSATIHRYARKTSNVKTKCLVQDDGKYEKKV